MFRLPVTLLTTVSSLTLMAVSGPVSAANAATTATTAAKATTAMLDVEMISVVGQRVNRKKVTGAATSISQEQLIKFKYDDVNRVLRFVPGVNLQEEDGFGLRPNIGLRGSGVERSSKITLMEDGVLIAPAPYASPSAYYFPVTGRMTGVEVRKGSAAIAYGPRTVGGAINLLSRAIPDEASGFADLRFGRFGQRTLHASYGGRVGDFGANLEYHGSRSDGFKNLRNDGDTGFSVDDFTFKGEYDITSGGDIDQSIAVKIGRTRQDSNETYLGLSGDDFAAAPLMRYAASQLDRIDSDHEQYQLTHKISGEGFSLITTAYQNNFTRDWFKFDFLTDDGTKLSASDVLETPSDFGPGIHILRGAKDSDTGAIALKHNARDYQSKGIQTALTLEKVTGELEHTIELSARYHEDYEDRAQYREFFTMQDGNLVYDSESALGSAGNRLSSAKALALFAQDTIQWGNWTLVPGVRVEMIDLLRTDFASDDPTRAGGATGTRENEINSVTPGIGFSYTFSDQWVLTGGLYEGFNPPGVGDNNAEEEKSTSMELGFAFNDDRFFVEAMSYYSDYSNILGTCTAASGCAGEIGDQFNGGAAEIYGLELTAMAGFDLSENWQLNFTGVYTYTHAEFNTNFSDGFWGDVVSGDSMPYVPAHQISLRANVTGNNFDFSAAMNHVSETRDMPGQGDISLDRRIDARTVVDLALTYHAIEGVDFFAGVDNLFDERFIVARRPIGLRPGKPRTWQLGVRYSF